LFSHFELFQHLSLHFFLFSESLIFGFFRESINGQLGLFGRLFFFAGTLGSFLGFCGFLLCLHTLNVGDVHIGLFLGYLLMTVLFEHLNRLDPFISELFHRDAHDGSHAAEGDVNSCLSIRDLETS
jgi:hypothetical protein